MKKKQVHNVKFDMNSEIEHFEKIPPFLTPQMHCCRTVSDIDPGESDPSKLIAI